MKVIPQTMKVMNQMVNYPLGWGWLRPGEEDASFADNVSPVAMQCKRYRRSNDAACSQM